MTAQQNLVTVRLLRAPVGAWDRAEAHYAELMREFSLLVIGARQSSQPEVPDWLAELMDDLLQRYNDSVAQPTPERDAARAAGQPEVDVTYQVPAEAGESAAQLGQRLREADAFCREGGLITLAPTEETQAFNRWYVEEFVRQTAGEPARPWPGSSQ